LPIVRSVDEISNAYLPLISSEVRGEEIAPEKETLSRGTETTLLTEDDESVRGLKVREIPDRCR
jgi:hypothetical protein